ncbi:MAG: glycosyl hydrolase family 28 protein, partial [Actinomycetota bacterium]
YRCRGPLQLRSSVELTFDPGIRLFFEFDPDAYLVRSHDARLGTLRRYEGTTLFSFSPLLYAFGETDVALTFAGGIGGNPIIDGDGMRWQAWAADVDQQRVDAGFTSTHFAVRTANNDDAPLSERYRTDPSTDALRPDLAMFFLCERVLIDGLQLVNAPFWMVHPVFSDELTFRNLVFDGQVINNDGFDIESCRNTLIENVQFNNHDDNVSIKAGRDLDGRVGVDVRGSILDSIESRYITEGRLQGPTDNVVVRNCAFKGHHAIAIGSEMSGGVQGVYAYDNHSPIEVEIALYLKATRSRGGSIHGVRFFDSTFTNVDSLVALIPNFDGDTEGPHPSEFRDVGVAACRARSATHGIRIIGWPDLPIRDVSIDEVTVDDVQRPHDELVIKNATNVRVKNATLGSTRVDELEANHIDPNEAPPVVM